MTRLSESRAERVCHLAYTFYDFDNRVIRYAETVQSRGGDVDVIALRLQGMPWAERLAGIRIFRIQRRATREKEAWTYLFKILWFMAKATVLLSVLHVRRPYDVVHVHNVPDFLVFAAVLPKLTGARIILDIHDILPEFYQGKFGADPDSLAARALRFVERLSCRFADHVIVANHLWHERLVSRSVPAAKCTAIMNYPDLQTFRPRASAWQGNGDRFVLMYPGSLNYHQGLDLAIRALALARDRMPGAELHIYGSGSAMDELGQVARDAHVDDRVHFKSSLPFPEIAKVIATADVGVVPKRADGFGNEAFSTKVLEFMSCGVPVIVSRTRVDAHYFDDSLVRFFDPGDERSLAEALVWAYEHRAEHAARAARAREFAVQNSWQERVGDYLGVLTAPERAPRSAA